MSAGAAAAQPSAEPDHQAADDEGGETLFEPCFDGSEDQRHEQGAQRQTDHEGDRERTGRAVDGDPCGPRREATDTRDASEAQQHDGRGRADHQAADQPLDRHGVGEKVGHHRTSSGILR